MVIAFIDILKQCHVKKVYMFHYGPESSDEFVVNILDRALEYKAKVPKIADFEIPPSYEGLVIDI